MRLAPTLVLLLSTACNLAPKALDPDSGAGGSGGSGGPSPFQVNDGTILPGEVVTLEGLVVTSGMTRDGEGFFVADPAGGPGSGLYVWGGNRFGDVTVPFSVGDEVSVTGEVQDFYGWNEFVVNGLDAITVTGTATVPEPVDLGDGAGVDWNAYESVLVRLTNQSIESVDSYNTATLSGGVKLDDGFQYLELQCGGTFDRLDGIVFYRYESHSVNPRSDADLGNVSGGSAGGAASLAQVQAGAVCGGVELTGLVVTAPDFGESKSTFFVQEPGTLDGVAVYVQAGLFDVAVGDVVSVTGSVTEFSSRDYDGSLTEIVVNDLANVTKTGTAAPVAVELTNAPSDWEPYEGELVTIYDVAATGAPDTYGQVAIDWAGIVIDDLYVTDLTATTSTRWASVTGVVNFAFGHFMLQPRTAADLVAP
jgi:predicted extracellular nuclease